MGPVIENIQEKNNKEKELVTRNFDVEYYPEKLLIDVDKSESSTIFLILIYFFILDTLDLFIAIQINLILLGIFSVIFDIIILAFLYSGYSNYKDLNIKWIFNKSIDTLEIYRKSSRIDERNTLSFQNIEAITISENIFVNDRFFVSIITKKHKKQKMCSGNREECYNVAKQLSEFLNKPIIQRNFYNLSFIVVSFTLFLSILTFFILFFLISIELIFQYIFFLILKTIIIISVLEIIFLLKEHIQAKNHYFKMLTKLS